MTHGIHLSLFKNIFVNNLLIYNYKAISPKEKIPPPLLLTHPVVNSVCLQHFITEINWVHIMIVLVVRIQTQNLSIMYHFFFRVIHLPFFLDPFNCVATHQDKMNSFFIIKWHSNKTGKVGGATNHRSLHCYPKNKIMKDK